jgi:hypothetical protein
MNSEPSALTHTVFEIGTILAAGFINKEVYKSVDTKEQEKLCQEWNNKNAKKVNLYQQIAS